MSLRSGTSVCILLIAVASGTSPVLAATAEEMRKEIYARIETLNVPPPRNEVLEPATGIVNAGAKYLALGIARLGHKDTVDRYNAHYYASLDYNSAAKSALGYALDGLDKGHTAYAMKYMGIARDYSVKADLLRSAAHELWQGNLQKVNAIEAQIAKKLITVAEVSFTLYVKAVGRPELAKFVDIGALGLEFAVDNAFFGRDEAVRSLAFGILAKLFSSYVETLFFDSHRVGSFMKPFWEDNKLLDAFIAELAEAGVKMTLEEAERVIAELKNQASASSLGGRALPHQFGSSALSVLLPDSPVVPFSTTREYIFAPLADPCRLSVCQPGYLPGQAQIRINVKVRH